MHANDRELFRWMHRPRFGKREVGEEEERKGAGGGSRGGRERGEVKRKGGKEEGWKGDGRRGSEKGRRVGT